MMQLVEAESFRFHSRPEYEQAIIEMLKKKDVSDEYETLMEEFLRFCSEKNNG